MYQMDYEDQEREQFAGVKVTGTKVRWGAIAEAMREQ